MTGAATSRWAACSVAGTAISHCLPSLCSAVRACTCGHVKSLADMLSGRRSTAAPALHCCNCTCTCSTAAPAPAALQHCCTAAQLHCCPCTKALLHCSAAAPALWPIAGRCRRWLSAVTVSGRLGMRCQDEHDDRTGPFAGRCRRWLSAVVQACNKRMNATTAQSSRTANGRRALWQAQQPVAGRCAYKRSLSGRRSNQSLASLPRNKASVAGAAARSQWPQAASTPEARIDGGGAMTAPSLHLAGACGHRRRMRPARDDLHALDDVTLPVGCKLAASQHDAAL
eukprot:352872-Chlamydomonas_euryale.AAC.7